MIRWRDVSKCQLRWNPAPRRACASRHRRGPTRPRRGELIDTKYGGTITKRYLYELRLAQRRASRSPIRLARSAYALAELFVRGRTRTSTSQRRPGARDSRASVVTSTAFRYSARAT